MPELAERLSTNIAGAYYVDSTCIDCDFCRCSSPEFFRRNDELGQSFVHRQPATAEEIQLAEEAVEGCPSNSIGNDGRLDGESPV